MSRLQTWPCVGAPPPLGRGLDGGKSCSAKGKELSIDIGLIGFEYTRADGYKYRGVGQLNEAGHVTGYSQRFNSGNDSLGYSAWLPGPGRRHRAWLSRFGRPAPCDRAAARSARGRVRTFRRRDELSRGREEHVVESLGAHFAELPITRPEATIVFHDGGRSRRRQATAGGWCGLAHSYEPATFRS